MQPLDLDFTMASPVHNSAANSSAWPSSRNEAYWILERGPFPASIKIIKFWVGNVGHRDVGLGSSILAVQPLQMLVSQKSELYLIYRTCNDFPLQKLLKSSKPWGNPFPQPPPFHRSTAPPLRVGLSLHQMRQALDVHLSSSVEGAVAWFGRDGVTCSDGPWGADHGIFSCFSWEMRNVNV